MLHTFVTAGLIIIILFCLYFGDCKEKYYNRLTQPVLVDDRVGFQTKSDCDDLLTKRGMHNTHFCGENFDDDRLKGIRWQTVEYLPPLRKRRLFMGIEKVYEPIPEVYTNYW